MLFHQVQAAGEGDSWTSPDTQEAASNEAQGEALPSSGNISEGDSVVSASFNILPHFLHISTE